MIEIELKGIPGKDTMQYIDTSPDFKPVSSEVQLNHYFESSTTLPLLLIDALDPHIHEDDFDTLDQLFDYEQSAESPPKYAIRTRSSSLLRDDQSLFILKYSLTDGSSENGTIRKELEILVELPISELDAIIQKYINVQSKWRRNRLNYIHVPTGFTVCYDFNAGYGQLIEVEKIAFEDEDEQTRSNHLSQLRQVLVDVLGCTELPAERLEQWFKVYSKNWEVFYPDWRLFSDFEEYRYLVGV